MVETLEQHLVESLRKSAWNALEKVVLLNPKSGAQICAELVDSDSVGEIVDRLAGSCKHDWVATGNQIERSVPNVIRKASANTHSDSRNGLRSAICADLGEQLVAIGGQL